MPTGYIKDLAARNHMDVSTVEAMWNDCKKGIKPGKGGKGWGLVVNCVQQNVRNAKKKG